MVHISIAVFVSICIVVALLLYISFTQYKRAEKALNIANTLAFNMQAIKTYIEEASMTLANPQLKAAFEADDEVGVFFKQILDIQETLNQFFPESEETSTDVE